MKSPETRRKPVQKRTKIVRDKTAFGKIFKQIRRLKTDAADSGKNPHFFPLFHTDTLAQRRRFRSFLAGQNDIKVLVFAFVFSVSKFRNIRTDPSRERFSNTDAPKAFPGKWSAHHSKRRKNDRNAAGGQARAR